MSTRLNKLLLKANIFTAELPYIKETLIYANKMTTNQILVIIHSMNIQFN